MKDIVFDGIGFSANHASSISEDAFVSDHTEFASSKWEAKTPQEVEKHLREVHKLAMIAAETLTEHLSKQDGWKDILTDNGNNSGGTGKTVSGSGPDSVNGGRSGSEPETNTRSKPLPTGKSGGESLRGTTGAVPES